MKIKNKLGKILKSYKEGRVVMMELPAEAYFEAASDSVKALVGQGFEGVYISFQRPFANVQSLFKQQGIDTNKFFIVDVATAFAQEEHKKHERCVHISPAIDIDELVRAIYTSMDKIKSKKKFIFIDSLTTVSLYKPLSEVLRFCEFLTRIVRNHKLEGVTLIFNVAKDLSQKKFIRDIAMQIDETISVIK